MSVLATDDFAGSGALGANWTTTPTYEAPNKVSGQVVNAGGGRDGAYYSGVAFPNEHYGQFKLVLFQARVLVRVSPVAGEYNGYYFAASTLTSGAEIVQYTNNVGASQLASDGNSTSANDVMYLEAKGTTTTTLIAKVNSVQRLNVDDSVSAFQGGSPGIAAGNVDGDTIDDFEGGDFVSASADPITELAWIGGISA